MEPAGIEPATSCLQSRRSISLNPGDLQGVCEVADTPYTRSRMCVAFAGIFSEFCREPRISRQK